LVCPRPGRDSGKVRTGPAGAMTQGYPRRRRRSQAGQLAIPVAATQQHSSRSKRARSLRRLSTVRLEMFSDGVFAIAVTLLAVQLRPPNLDGITTVGGLLQALFEQRTQFGYTP
jgi:Endosomal/lysosomal potassium channel TMEM175